MHARFVAVAVLLSVPAQPLVAQDSSDVSHLLQAALDTLQRVSRHRTEVDWTIVRDSTFLLARGARETRDAYPVIAWLLRRIDRHSFLQAERRGAEGALLRSRFGYVRVPSFEGGMIPALADTLQTSIRALDHARACGWIVDLRGNGGGNMWPMLAGIGPLLADTISGWLVMADRRQAWSYAHGAAALDTGAARQVLVTADTIYVLRNPRAPVAVLTDAQTASSGEAIAVAFRGRANARSFGAATAGVSTVNAGFRLPDGANMVITTGVYADRTGRMYGDSIVPDERIATPLRGATLLEGDPVVARALGWLADQSSCRP
jgi:carboxyl-terminal processing protease